jgi:hypothetical protein
VLNKVDKIEINITHEDSIINFIALNLSLAEKKAFRFTYYNIIWVFSMFTLLTRSDIFCFCLLTRHCLILYVCSAQSNTRSMTSEEGRLARLRRTLHSLATRVPKVILTRVDRTFPVLKRKTVSVMHSVLYLYQKHLHHYVSSYQNCLHINCCARKPH